MQNGAKTYEPWFICFDERFSLFVDLLHSVWISEVLDNTAAVLLDGANNAAKVGS